MFTVSAVRGSPKYRNYTTTTTTVAGCEDATLPDARSTRSTTGLDGVTGHLHTESTVTPYKERMLITLFRRLSDHLLYTVLLWYITEANSNPKSALIPKSPSPSHPTFRLGIMSIPFSNDISDCLRANGLKDKNTRVPKPVWHPWLLFYSIFHSMHFIDMITTRYLENIGT